MKRFILVVSLMVTAGAFAQLPMTDLVQIKIAAEAGDAAAQDKLAEQYRAHSDTSQALIWYRKAATQGYTDAQAKLGNMLWMRYEMHLDRTPETRAAVAAEALKWISLAANEGNKSAQSDFAQMWIKGSIVGQNYLEAYKWGELASRTSSSFEASFIMGKSTRDSAVLKLNTAQLEEAQARVNNFVVKSATPDQVAEPAGIKELHLNGISGKPDDRLALINNRTFGVGDKITLKLGEKSVRVQCLEIREASVIVSVEGVTGTRELKNNVR